MLNLRILLALTVVLLGSGCSVKFTYNNLDRFARWGVSDYLAMNEEQRRYFDAEFAKLHTWHRTSQLPRYAAALESLPVLMADGVDAEEVVALEVTVLGWANEVEEHAMPLFVDMLCSMTDAQVARLPQLLEATNREFAEPEFAASLDTSQQRWRDEVADMFARFAGRLSDAQQEYLIRQSSRYLPERVLWAEYRRRWQADLLVLLQKRAERQWFAEQVMRLAASRQTYYGSELTRIVEHNEALSREVGAWLLNHMTERQQARLLERLLELAVEFRELAAEEQNPLPLPDGCLVSC